MDRRIRGLSRAKLVASRRCVDMDSNRPIESGSQRGSNSAVECDLAKVEVAGSNPVSRSRVSRRRQSY